MIFMNPLGAQILGSRKLSWNFRIQDLHLTVDDLFWLVVEPYPSEKYMKVSWDDEIPNIWQKMFQTTSQYGNSSPHNFHTEAALKPSQ